MQATDTPTGIIVNILADDWRDNPKLLARRIVIGLDRAAYEIRPKPELIPRPNPRPIGRAAQFPLLALNPDLSANARQVKPPALVLP